MMVMMYDCRTHFDSFLDDLQEALYADDTLLVGNDPKNIQRYMNVIAEEGKRYGLLWEPYYTKMVE